MSSIDRDKDIDKIRFKHGNYFVSRDKAQEYADTLKPKNKKQMKEKGRYNVGDVIWIMFCERPNKAIVSEILYTSTIDLHSESLDRNDKPDFSITEKFEYKVNKIYSDGKISTLRHTIRDEDMFASKEELIKTLFPDEDN